VEFERLDEFENELRQALERRPAPPGLKGRVIDQRNRRRTLKLHNRMVIWQRLAAILVLAAVLGGGFMWREREERRKGEAAREQVLTALRITSRVLGNMNAQMAAHRHGTEE
jgi:hypothetical protein